MTGRKLDEAAPATAKTPRRSRCNQPRSIAASSIGRLISSIAACWTVTRPSWRTDRARSRSTAERSMPSLCLRQRPVDRGCGGSTRTFGTTRTWDPNSPPSTRLDPTFPRSRRERCHTSGLEERMAWVHAEPWHHPNPWHPNMGSKQPPQHQVGSQVRSWRPGGLRTLDPTMASGTRLDRKFPRSRRGRKNGVGTRRTAAPPEPRHHPNLGSNMHPQHQVGSQVRSWRPGERCCASGWKKRWQGYTPNPMVKARQIAGAVTTPAGVDPCPAVSGPRCAPRENPIRALLVASRAGRARGRAAVPAAVSPTAGAGRTTTVSGGSAR